MQSSKSQNARTGDENQNYGTYEWQGTRLKTIEPSGAGRYRTRMIEPTGARSTRTRTIESTSVRSTRTRALESMNVREWQSTYRC
ncbi:hypothetical protein AJ78_03061 [Emergomyces pasteurianus Ep9510]|uniref:Uncharacterized protein n=1 Tax=Emergomyces pasteurianus Ep9510 TaxID=1447872 RepID=A0A1J9PLQ9_9EURO|nr:hypothetical protein AJ78_03061 [Emergomyces pasteurianus Ep9510]